MTSAKTILVLSQVYAPDPAAVGQYMHDAASELVRRGHRVVVLTAARGYDDPKQKYPRRELRDGVEIRRLPLASFGKSSIPIRLFGAAIFLVQALLRGLFVRRLRGVLVSTSPPMCTAVAWLLGLLRRTPFTFWVMDINPDQAVLLGRFKAGSLPVRVFDALNRRVLRRARSVVHLDARMAERMNRKHDTSDKTTIIPPWPLVPVDADLPAADNPFRAAHGLVGKFVFMYSGNHSPAHPVDTIVDAAGRLEDRDDIVFVFVGGGQGKVVVDDAVAGGARNLRSLPYQPLDQLRWSLAAADVHLVTFAESMVGVVHPCKAYGALAAARPILLVGPRDSHIGSLIDAHAVGWCVAMGDTDALQALIEDIVAGQAGDLERMGRAGHEAMRTELSTENLRQRFCDVVEAALKR